MLYTIKYNKIRNHKIWRKKSRKMKISGMRKNAYPMPNT